MKPTARYVRHIPRDRTTQDDTVPDGTERSQPLVPHRPLPGGGHCGACGALTEADAGGAEVCGGCIRRVRALYELVRPASPSGPGWLLVEGATHDGSGHVVRDHTGDVFEDDEAAAAHIVGLIAPPTAEEAAGTSASASPEG